MSSKPYKQIFLAQQPVFDKEQHLWGYLMLFRDSKNLDKADFNDPAKATLDVIGNQTLVKGNCDGNAQAMYHFTPQSIVDGLTTSIPSDCSTLVIDETTEVSEALLEALATSREQGFKVAVNNFTGAEEALPLLDLADIIIIDMHKANRKDVVQLVTVAKALSSAKLMAKRVETHDQFDEAHKAGFDLFHGYVFKAPDLRTARKITSGELTRLRLFEVIERDEPDFDALAKAVESDVALSYRLLTFLNSASFSFSVTIKSIRQAVILAGWKPIRNWMRIIILTDFNQTQRGQELSYISAHRAKMFETCALGANMDDTADKLFLLGLFSLLDALFEVDAETITASLPLDQDVRDAICGKDNWYSKWLRLAEAIEQTQWDKVADYAKELDLLPGTVAVSYQHAFTWADSFFGQPVACRLPRL